MANTHRFIDIEELGKKAQQVFTRKFETPTDACIEKYRGILEDLYRNPGMTDGAFNALKNKYKFNGKNSFLIQVLDALKARQEWIGGSPNDNVETSIRERLRIKKGKSTSGILAITVFTSPYPEWEDDDGIVHVQEFSCKADCAYCPKQPGQPRSYLELEPGVLRANKNKFNTIEQMWDRLISLQQIGHPIDKLEVLVLGGTWSHYPAKYQETFCRDIYYSANTFFDVEPRRPPKGLEEEIMTSRSARVKIVGLTLETRPDAINEEELVRFRRYGCTRVQLGVQHTHDDVLRKINRGCSHADTIRSIQMLKDNGFKVEIHTMPNLPGSSVEKDRDMYDMLLGVQFPPVPQRWNDEGGAHWEVYHMKHSELQVDGWKVYPCTVVPWTDIEKWFREGSYVPYSDNEMESMLLDVLATMVPWVRMNRIIRDISGDYIICGINTNLRNTLEHKLELEGKMCACIRCREVKSAEWKGDYIVVVRKFEGGSGSSEYFISCESKDMKTLYGFLRLRLPGDKVNNIFHELSGCALLRELHVYGQLAVVGQGNENNNAVQHKGLGKILITKAKEIARAAGWGTISVIPGEGVREYYEKIGFSENTTGIGRFMCMSTSCYL